MESAESEWDVGKVWGGGWRKNSVRKVLPCKHGDLHLISRTKEDTGFCDTHLNNKIIRM